MPERIYDENRLKYPLKRIGAKGEGKFARISWEEAIRHHYFPMEKTHSKIMDRKAFFLIVFMETWEILRQKEWIVGSFIA